MVPEVARVHQLFVHLYLAMNLLLVYTPNRLPRTQSNHPMLQSVGDNNLDLMHGCLRMGELYSPISPSALPQPIQAPLVFNQPSPIHRENVPQLVFPVQMEMAGLS